MKKTILKSVMLTAIASLAMSGYVSAHHPTFFMDEDLYYTIDGNISDQHNEVIGDVTAEDFELMGSLTMSMDANDAPTAAAGDATMQTSSGIDATANAGEAPNVTQSGMSGAGGVSSAQNGR